MSDTLPRIVTDVQSFEVRCSIGQFVMDGPDDGKTPDLAAMSGKVTIAPDLKKPLRVRGENPLEDRVVGVNALEFTLDPVTGQLVHPDGTVGVELIDPNDEHLDPKGWTYTATVSPTEGNRWSVTFGSPGDGDRVVNIGALAGVEISPGQGGNVVQEVVAARDESTAAASTASTAAVEASSAASDAAASATYAAEVAYGHPLTVTDTVVAGILGTATTSRAVADTRYRRAVSSAEHGATGDGVTDDTAAIQAAVNAAASLGLTTVVPAGTYRLTSTIDLPSNTNLRFDPSVTLDITSVPVSVPAISAQGTIAATVPLADDATEGSRTLTLADTTGFTVGDWVKVSSTLPFGYTGQPAGEIQQITAVDGTTLTLAQGLDDTYATADSAAVAKVTLRENVNVSGGTMLGNRDSPTTSHRGVVLELCRNVTVTGMAFRWVHYVAVWLRDSVGVSVHDCRFDDALLPGMGYGVMMTEATQDVSVSSCHGTRTRHAVTFGGGARPGIIRRVTVTGCTFSQCLDAGLDAHPGAEDIVFSGNTISGSLADGIVMQGGRFVISNNVVTGSGGHGILIQNLTRKGIGGAVSGNRIAGTGGNGVYVGVNTAPAWRVWSGLSITGNVVSDGRSSGISIYNSDPSFKAEGVTITGNTLRRHASHSVYLRGVQDASIGTNHVADTTGPVESIYLYECADVAVTGNAVTGGVRIIRARASTGVTVLGNRGTGATTGVLADAASGPVVVMGNNFAGCTAGLSLAGAGNITGTADAAGAYNI